VISSGGQVVVVIIYPEWTGICVNIGMYENYLPFTRNAKKLMRERVEKIVSTLVMAPCNRSFHAAGEMSFDKVSHDSVLLSRYGRTTVSPALANFCFVDGGTDRPFSASIMSSQG